MTAAELQARLTRAAMAEDDPLGALDRMLEQLRGRVLRQALEESGWSINGAARRLRRAASTVDYAIRKAHPELVREAAEKGPGRGAR